MLITRTDTWQPGFRKRTSSKELKIGPISLKFITIALLAIGALFYLAASNQSASQKYQIMQLEDTKEQLEAQTKELEVEAVRLKSLSEIKSGAEGLGLQSQTQNE